MCWVVIESGTAGWASTLVKVKIRNLRTGNVFDRIFKTGDKVKVQINNVSVIRRRIDFTLIATAACVAATRRASGRRCRASTRWTACRWPAR